MLTPKSIGAAYEVRKTGAEAPPSSRGVLGGSAPRVPAGAGDEADGDRSPPGRLGDHGRGEGPLERPPGDAVPSGRGGEGPPEPLEHPLGSQPVQHEPQD